MTESSFPGDSEAIPVEKDASEFRDIDISTTVPAKTTEFSGLDNYGLRTPLDARATGVSGRRTYANGPELDTAKQVEERAARIYDAWTRVAVAAAGTFTGAPSIVVGTDPYRARLLITNTHATDAVLIGPLGSVANGSGYSLLAGETLETIVQGEIYAAVPVDGTENVNLGVWVEKHA